jgi:peptidoglycan/LPS O-acetylase OafA/YrhL
LELKNTKASLALDLLRALAAQAVCVGHTIGLFGIALWAQPPHVPYMQNVAVLIFFLLSGFLIAYTLASRSQDPTYGFGRYLIDRFARIYSALVPALVLIAVIDFTALVLTGEERSTFTVRNFIGNLFMVQDVTAPAWIRKLDVHSFGTAGQLWTLAIEWHLYLFAGAVFFVRRSLLMPLIVLISAWIPLNYATELTRQDFGHGLTLLWFAGFVSYYALPYAQRLPAWSLACVAIGIFAAYVAVVPPGAEFTISTYCLLAISFFCVVSIAGRFNASDGVAARVIRLAAAYSFTLYLVHNSLIKLIAKAWTGNPMLAAVVAILAANVLAFVVARHTEMRHKELSIRIRSYVPRIGMLFR